MYKLISLILNVTFILFLTVIPAHSKTVYSLFDLTELADMHSQNIRIAQDDLFIAEQEKQRALSVLIPRATVFGSVLERKDPSQFAPNTVTYGGRLTQSFTLNGKELIALNITKEAIQGRSYSLESIRSQYMLAVVQAYYDILSAQRIHEIALSDVERLTAFRDSVVEKLNVGNVTRTDLYRAEAELSKALTEEVVSQNNILKNKAVLRNLVDVDDEYDLEKETLDGIESYRFQLDDIQSTALKMRAEIKEAKKNYIIAEKTVDFNKGDYWPTLSFEAGYTEVDTEYPMDSGFDFENNEDDIYISGELVFTLYDGGLRKATVRQAMAEQRQAKNALELAEKEVILESKNAFYDYESSQRALVNLEDELKSAQETYNAVQMQLQYGMADYLDVVDANTLLVSAQRRKTDAQYTYYLSVLRILYTKGELLEFLSSRKS